MLWGDGCVVCVLKLDPLKILESYAWHKDKTLIQYISPLDLSSVEMFSLNVSCCLRAGGVKSLSHLTVSYS